MQSYRGTKESVTQRDLLVERESGREAVLRAGREERLTSAAVGQVAGVEAHPHGGREAERAGGRIEHTLLECVRGHRVVRVERRRDARGRRPRESARQDRVRAREYLGASTTMKINNKRKNHGGRAGGLECGADERVLSEREQRAEPGVLDVHADVRAVQRLNGDRRAHALQEDTNGTCDEH